MHRTGLASVALLSGLTLMGCDVAPAVESERADAEMVEKEAAQKRERSEEAAELERRADNLESQWTEMQTKVKTRGLCRNRRAARRGSGGYKERGGRRRGFEDHDRGELVGPARTCP